MNLCEHLHRVVASLPLYKYPVVLEALPDNGIILTYEHGQAWGHGGDEPRIVHVGSHRDGNLAHRLSEHFLLDERKMDFTVNGAAPKDRSILRKTIGRALLNMAGDPYLAMLDVDFTKRINRDRFGGSRELEREKAVESAVTDYIRSRFSFRVIPVLEQNDRLGSCSLKSRIIATAAQCDSCCPTPDWLGNHAPDEKICHFGLWQVQQTRGDVLNEGDFEFLVRVTPERPTATSLGASPA